MTPAQLHWHIERLSRRSPVTDHFEHAIWPRPRRAWYPDHKEHWQGWLAGHVERGTTSAQRVYDFILCPPMLLYLGEAAARLPYHELAAAASAGQACKPRRKAECDAIRRVIPWAIIARNLGDGH